MRPLQNLPKLVLLLETSSSYLMPIDFACGAVNTFNEKTINTIFTCYWTYYFTSKAGF